MRFMKFRCEGLDKKRVVSVCMLLRPWTLNAATMVVTNMFLKREIVPRWGIVMKRIYHCGSADGGTTHDRHEKFDVLVRAAASSVQVGVVPITKAKANNSQNRADNKINVCHGCQTRTTPMWRRHRDLLMCNACGTRLMRGRAILVERHDVISDIS